MKKFFAILLCLALMCTVAACENTVPNAFSVPWSATNVPSEYTEYDVEFAEYSQDITVKGTVIATGKQSVYIRVCEDKKEDGSLLYPDCIKMTTERTVTYLSEDENGDPINVTYSNGEIATDNRGKTDVQFDEVIFKDPKGWAMVGYTDWAGQRMEDKISEAVMANPKEAGRYLRFTGSSNGSYDLLEKV